MRWQKCRYACGQLMKNLSAAAGVGNGPEELWLTGQKPDRFLRSDHITNFDRICCEMGQNRMTPSSGSVVTEEEEA